MNDIKYIPAEQITGVKCEKECQETVISWGRNDQEVTVCTSDPTTVTKLKNIMLRDPEHYLCYYHENDIDKQSGYPACYFFQFKKSLLTYRVQNSTKNLTSEEKLARVSRLNKNSF